MPVFHVQSLTGLALTILVCWALSEGKNRFPWKLAIGALLVQVLLVILLFAVPVTRNALQGVAGAVVALGDATAAGTQFIFGYLAGGGQPYNLSVANQAPFLFGFRVLPVILVVCALSALLWHWKILKWIIQGCGFIFQKALGLRGPPGLAAAATIFMGQIEGPIVIRAYLDKLTRSELFMLLSVGMSCVSGSTMVAYVSILQANVANAAAHVLTASIISAPAGILLARIMVPPDLAEKGEDLTPGDEKRYDSSIDAVIKGTGDGIQVAVNVAAALIVFVALAALVNMGLGHLNIGGQPMTIERIFGVIFAPLAWSLGLPWKEAGEGGQLLGVKLVLTEFTAFIRLGGDTELSERSRMIMTYALCGFANIASVGMNVAGYSVLAPQRRGEVIGMVWKAMIVGFLATCMTASLIGFMPGALFQ